MSDARAGPRGGFAAVPAEPDVVVVGAGAAGIAAARACLAAGLSCAVLEARDRVGGRCVTAPIGGHPVDLGAHWLHAGGVNPLVALGKHRGEPLEPTRFASSLVIDGAPADEITLRAHGEAFAKASAALEDASARETDSSIADVLPDLGRWSVPVRATLALISGRPLEEVSAHDFPADEFGDNWLVRGGYGAYLARLAEGLPIARDWPVEHIDWSGRDVEIAGPRGRLRGRAAIVTVPVAVLAAGAIRFTPGLPERTRDAIAAFLPGTYDHVVLDWPDSPFEGPDRFAKVVGRTSSYGLSARLDGSPLHFMEIDHATVEAHGRRPDALAAFAGDWIAGELGHDAVRGLRVLHVTDWMADPWSREAWAVARPHRRSDRRTLAEPIGDRLRLAGEAMSVRMWGTVGGAWEEGEAAAAAIAAQLGAGAVQKSASAIPFATDRL